MFWEGGRFVYLIVSLSKQKSVTTREDYKAVLKSIVFKLILCLCCLLLV